MRFIYPAIVRKTEDGMFHARFPDLAMCEAKGDSIDDVMRNATAAAHDWIDLEFQEEYPDFPPATDEADIITEDGETVRQVLVIYRIQDGWEE
ncbi:MAG: type II toxin-antitoxin system HicB family antitoxin [Lachnospiraceae bacterium]|nr:type II toxin-antitoxin system HicB family antitoxin [Lachnospiraceae bacterium]